MRAFCRAEFLAHLAARGLDYIVVTPLHARRRQRRRHEDAAWTPTDVPGLEAQEVEGAELDAPGRRLILLRQRVAERPEAGGKRLLEVPKFAIAPPHRAWWRSLLEKLQPHSHLGTAIQLAPSPHEAVSNCIVPA